MKKITALIATALVTSSTDASIYYMSGGLTDHSLREPFTYTISPGISTSGYYNLTVDAGLFFNSGSMSIDYNLKGNAGGYAYDVTYSGVTYNLGTASGEILDQNYNGQGKWLTRYSWGYSKDNTVSWGTNKSQTLAAGKPSDVRDTNGSYLGNRNGNNAGGENGTMAVTGGSSTCVGNGCSLWSANSFGLEGMELYMVVDPNSSFTLVDHWVTMQEVVGTSAPFQISITGSQAFNACLPGEWLGTEGEPDYYYCGDETPPIEENPNPVPVPAAAWLMGSGLLGLAGIARRKKS